MKNNFKDHNICNGSDISKENKTNSSTGKVPIAGVVVCIILNLIIVVCFFTMSDPNFNKSDSNNYFTEENSNSSTTSNESNSSLGNQSPSYTSEPNETCTNNVDTHSYSGSKKYEEDPYNTKDYGDEEDFYDDNYDDFDGFEDAEDYYNEWAE